MLPTTAETCTLYLFECREGHRVYRRDNNNRANCSRCGGQFALLVSLARGPDETENQHQVRTLAWNRLKKSAYNAAEQNE